MAFTNQAPAAAQANDSWKAAAFINIYLAKPGAEGGRIKIGAIPLKAGKKFDAALIKRLSEDSDAMDAMIEVLEMDFQLVNDPNAPATALPF